MKCIVCKLELKKYKIIHTKVRNDIQGNSKIIKCEICGHIQLSGYRQNLKNHYDFDKQTEDIIKNLKLTLEQIINKEKKEIQRRILKINLNLNKLKILDVGAGYCSFGEIVKKKYPLCDISVIEPSLKRINKGKLINNLKDVNIINSFLDNNFIENNIDKYDLVTCWHVLEHIDEKNIDNFLKNLFKICKKNGKIIIEIPNGNDELYKFEKYKNINYMIHHISYFTQDSISKLLKNNYIKNFKIEFVQRYGFKNYINWIYDLGYNFKDDMFYPSENKFKKLWLEGRIKNKNTDALWIEINKI